MIFAISCSVSLSISGTRTGTADVARRGDTGGPFRRVVLPGRETSPEPSTTDWERTNGTAERGDVAPLAPALLTPLLPLLLAVLLVVAAVPFGRAVGCGGSREEDGRLGTDAWWESAGTFCVAAGAEDARGRMGNFGGSFWDAPEGLVGLVG